MEFFGIVPLGAKAPALGEPLGAPEVVGLFREALGQWDRFRRKGHTLRFDRPGLIIHAPYRNARQVAL